MSLAMLPSLITPGLQAGKPSQKLPQDLPHPHVPELCSQSDDKSDAPSLNSRVVNETFPIRMPLSCVVSETTNQKRPVWTQSCLQGLFRVLTDQAKLKNKNYILGSGVKHPISRKETNKSQDSSTVGEGRNRGEEGLEGGADNEETVYSRLQWASHRS